MTSKVRELLKKESLAGLDCEKVSVVENMHDREYHSWKDIKEHHFSSSQLKQAVTMRGAQKLVSDMFLHQKGMLREESENPRFYLGRLAHLYAEEGEYIPQLCHDHEGLPNSAYNEFVRVMIAIDRNPDLFSREGLQREVSIFALLNHSLKVKSRFDAYDPLSRTLYDWKTCSSTEESKIKYALRTYRYAASLALYRKVMESAGFPVEEVKLVFIGKDLPSIYVYTLSEKELQEGGEIIVQGMNNLEECLKNV